MKANFPLSPKAVDKVTEMAETAGQSTTTAPKAKRNLSENWNGPPSFAQSRGMTSKPSHAPLRLRGGAGINSHENIYARIQEGKCKDYVVPQTTFDGTSSHLEAAIDIVKNALGPIFPPDFNRVHIVEADPGDDIKGSTLVAEDGQSARIKIKTDASLDKQTQQGLYAHTLAHELFLHAQSGMDDKALGAPERSESDDHRHTYSPPSSDNRYLQAMRRVHDGLGSAEAKRSFAFAMQQDMLDQLEQDEDIGQTEFDQINLWTSSRRDSMDDAIDNRDKHKW
ncbi:hypothetical protein G3O00_41290 [Burkholderia sp. Ac-20384]|uniref:hypothetical protein n=1 Tax=Burkholderia sp. Ac-20384 TaxID=2703902 RepID=UPI00197EC8A2|nr:hypothetical protein [Burkholderia sp. Ac-20384]MBN3829954.1 hypothetical protein [Burkholderia sp. Ac-20384]